MQLELSVIVEIDVDVERLTVTTSFWCEQVLVKCSVHTDRCSHKHTPGVVKVCCKGGTGKVSETPISSEQ